MPVVCYLYKYFQICIKYKFHLPICVYFFPSCMVILYHSPTDAMHILQNYIMALCVWQNQKTNVRGEKKFNLGNTLRGKEYVEFFVILLTI